MSWSFTGGPEPVRGSDHGVTTRRRTVIPPRRDGLRVLIFLIPDKTVLRILKQGQDGSSVRLTQKQTDLYKWTLLTGLETQVS